jgi:hypothetical protein
MRVHLHLTSVIASVTVAASLWSMPSAAAEAGHDKQAWALSLDNDLFVPAGTDRDFTAGMALTYSGLPGLRHWSYLDEGLAFIDALHGLSDGASAVTPSIEFGAYGFTPEAIDAREPQRDDRPYASLAYVSASRIYQAPSGRYAWTSAITLGVLGSDVFNDSQRAVHEITGSDRARGWEHQISDGGELTLRYQAAYHQYWATTTPSTHVKTTYFASVGYLTEAGIALSTRSGRISSPDHRFNPELISYGERVNETGTVPYSGDESYFWGGVALKVRVYNAFLQGQLRDSTHTLHTRQLRPLLAEAWVGYTSSITRDIKFSYVLRAQSSEIREGRGDRALLWGGLVLSRAI